MITLNEILEISAARHNHLCPRQVLGVRIGLAGAQALGLEIPRNDKRLIVILETDGCFADGVEAATGCTVGHRTLRVEDYGKVAATFVNSKTGQSVRVTPVLDVRERANLYAAGEKRRFFTQLIAYQVMLDVELLSIREVSLTSPVDSLVGRPGVHVNCELCGEEIINGRQVMEAGMILCRACAKSAYYQPSPIEIHLPAPSLVRSPGQKL